MLAGGAIAYPVALFLALVWLLMVRPGHPGPLPALVFGGAVALVLASSMTAYPVLAVGGVTAVLVFVSLRV